jgi:hypothetical protein
MAIKIQSAKRKGRQFEYEIAERIAVALGLPREDVRPSIAGASGKDIQLSNRAIRAFPYWVECKNHKIVKIPAWVRQAEEGASKESTLQPVVVFKLHRGRKRYVVMELDHFLGLVKETPWEQKKALIKQKESQTRVNPTLWIKSTGNHTRSSLTNILT